MSSQGAAEGGANLQRRLKNAPHGSVSTGTLTLRIPLAIRRRGGRKFVIAPGDRDGSCGVGEVGGAPTNCGRVGLAVRGGQMDAALVKALARAHRWKRMLETEDYTTTAELAEAEKINPSYLARLLRLTLLAPDLTEAILDGQHDPDRVTLAILLQPFPLEWEKQRQLFR